MKSFLRLSSLAIALTLCASNVFAQTRSGLRYYEPFSVDGLGIGMPVISRSPEYKRYKCEPSEQYENAVFCTFSERDYKSQNMKLTILHLYNNIVTYINKSVWPAAVNYQDANNEIDRLSALFGSKPRTYPSPVGIMAVWGEIQLQRINQNEMMSLAQGQKPALGFLVDYLMNFQESPRLDFRYIR